MPLSIGTVVVVLDVVAVPLHACLRVALIIDPIEYRPAGRGRGVAGQLDLRHVTMGHGHGIGLLNLLDSVEELHRIRCDRSHDGAPVLRGDQGHGTRPGARYPSAAGSCLPVIEEEASVLSLGQVVVVCPKLPSMPHLRYSLWGPPF
jgi:hypothetical protein